MKRVLSRLPLVLLPPLLLATATGLDAQDSLPPGLQPLVTSAVEARTLSGPLDDLLRIAEIHGVAPRRSRLIRRLSAPGGPADGPALELLPVRMRLVFNSGYPRGGNDGLLWGGRGASTLIDIGAAFRWGPLSAAIAPEIAWHQNADVEVFDPAYSTEPGDWMSPYAHPYPGIDYPQRFGPSSFREAGWGRSYVRLDAFGAAVGFSTENMWWGPATRYPLLMSNTAPGFPHLFAGTSRPISIGIGSIEAELSWGGLRESAHFDDSPYNQERTFVGLVVAFSPAWPAGLTLGAARAFQHLPTATSWIRDVEAFQEPSSIYPGDDLFSFFGRWIPLDGVEAYVEVLAPSDFEVRECSIVYDDVCRFTRPGLMGGLQATWTVSEHVTLRGQLEAADLFSWDGRTRDYSGRVVRQGYTHRGQLLGAMIGPAGEGEFLAIDALTDLGMLGVFYERISRSREARSYRTTPGADVETTGGLRALSRPWNDLVIGATLSWSSRYTGDPRSNLGLDLHMTWVPAL